MLMCIWSKMYIHAPASFNQEDCAAVIVAFEGSHFDAPVGSIFGALNLFAQKRRAQLDMLGFLSVRGVILHNVGSLSLLKEPVLLLHCNPHKAPPHCLKGNFRILRPRPYFLIFLCQSD